MKKETKFSLSLALIFSLSGCVVAAPHSHNHKHKRYYDCTQVQEANGECENRVIPDSGEDMRVHRGEDGPRYRGNDGIMYISKQGRSLPWCNEDNDASQADNGSKCWWTNN